MNLSSYTLEYANLVDTTDLALHADPVVLAEIANDKGMSSAEDDAHNSRYDFLAETISRELLEADTELFEDFLYDDMDKVKDLLRMALSGSNSYTLGEKVRELTEGWVERLGKSNLVHNAVIQKINVIEESY